MQDLLADLIDSARARAGYADARFVRSRVERLSTRNGALDQLDSGESEGIGVRVRVGGAWGFAAVRGTDRRDAEAALARALAIAEAQPAVPEATPLAPEPPAQGEWANLVARDPFEVPLEEKLAILLAADAGLRTEPGVNLTLARFSAFQTDKIFASTEGALCEQRITECGGGIAAVAVDGETARSARTPRRTAATWRRPDTSTSSRSSSLGMRREWPSEAVALPRAPACPPGRKTLILAGEQLGLQVHESVGHAVELDRVLGREASYAGTSFVPADGIGSLRFGSEHVSVTADATNSGGLGSFRWDDEGVEGRPVPIVRDGVLAGFLSSRETAAEIGLARSGGCMRAEGFDRQPIVRMTNVNLEPGAAGSLEDLIADTDDGLLIETNRSWSIDNRRLHFQFEGEPAWEIKGGERGRLLRNPSYAGVTPEFWGSCDAVCSAARLAADLAARLREGRARPGDAGLPWHRPRALQRRAGRRGVNTLEVAERAAGHAGPEALALVTHERSLMLRFAASRPTQSTGIDDVTVEIAVPLRGNVGRAATNAVDDQSLADCAARARLAAEAAAATHDGSFPGFAPSSEATVLKSFDPATAELDPATGGTALADAFVEAEAHGVEAHGIWTVAEQDQAWATAGPGRRGAPNRCVHEGDLHRAERAQRLRVAGGRGCGCAVGGRWPSALR